MKKSTYVYQAIIATLVIHVAVLSVLYFTNPLSHGDVPAVSHDAEMEVDMEFISESELKKIQEEQNQIPDYLAARLKNLQVNENSQRTNQEVSYSKKTNERLSEDKYNELKAYEESIYQELHKNDATTEKSVDKVEIEKYKKSDKLWSNEEKSYAGTATVSYKINGKDRSQRNLPIPSYKCRVSGTVTVDIVINKAGDVLEVKINDMLTTTSNECLLSEALSYARKSSFVSALDVPRRQTGTITYNYSAQ